ncbi:MAG: MBL fold metallo-hydrolase [Candidatus Margulisiibacteriota bacterium]|jgi:glyoxylase-like metal-dependent hydrolase (beta-lactamase superfamily II)
MINTYQINQIQLGSMQNYTYLIKFDKNKALLIDPGWEPQKIAAALEGLDLIAILLTHGHFDHCTAVPEIQQKFQVPVYLSKFEADLYCPKAKLVAVADQEELTFSDLTIKCLLTPGHTPGSQCFLLDTNLFTGDTLFLEGCGRWDLPFGNKEDLKKSIKKIAGLPDATVIYPGHNYHELNFDTLAHQKISNPCFSENF